MSPKNPDPLSNLPDFGPPAAPDRVEVVQFDPGESVLPPIPGHIHDLKRFPPEGNRKELYNCRDCDFETFNSTPTVRALTRPTTEADVAEFLHPEPLLP